MKLYLWLVIANTTEAKIYQIQNRTGYNLIKHLSHEKSRLRSGELVTDKPGNYRFGPSGHGQFSPTNDAHEDEKNNFAREIAAFLDQERKNNHYHALILCVDAHFHGILNKQLSQPVHDLIKRHLKKNYIPLPENKLNDTIEAIIHGDL